MDALNSTGSVTSENTTTSPNRIIPTLTSGSHENISPKKNSGIARLEPTLTTGTIAERSISGL